MSSARTTPLERPPVEMSASEAETHLTPENRRRPSDAYLWQELDSDRLGERVLILKAIIALAFVGVLIVIRQVFFL
jgi:hypothetical protein